LERARCVGNGEKKIEPNVEKRLVGGGDASRRRPVTPGGGGKPSGRASFNWGGKETGLWLWVKILEKLSCGPQKSPQLIVKKKNR